MSDQDPRIREMTYRLLAMAPDAPPFPQEGIMKASVTKQRSPAMIWAAAALAVVLLVGLPMLFLRGGDEGPTTTVAAGDTTTTAVVETTVPGETTTVVTQPSREKPMTSGDCAGDYAMLEAYQDEAVYVFYSCDRPGMEDTLVPHWRSPKSGDVAQDLIDAMVYQLEGPYSYGPLLEAGYSSFSLEDIILPNPVAINVSFPGDVRFDFSDFRFDSGMANASASAASAQLIAQLTSSAFQFPEVETVTFTFDGDCDAFWNWLQRDCTTITRSDWANGEITAGVAAWLAGEPLIPPTTDAEPPSTTTLPSTPTSLPGEPFDIGPAEGDVIAVIGVAYKDVLWLRDGPGVGYEPWLGLDPLADNLVATGRHRLVPGAIWDEVVVDGVTGWVNSSYVGYMGGTEDLTRVVEDRVGEAIETETMLEMGQIVAESLASFDETGGRIVVSVAPTGGDLGEITMDVFGLADDAQLGWRLYVFGSPAASGEGFVLKSVEGTAFCGRGVTAEGWCI